MTPQVVRNGPRLAMLAAAASLLLGSALAARQQQQPPPRPADANQPQEPRQWGSQGGARQGPFAGRLPGRDAREPVGTARLRGTVIAADTGTPLRRAVVRISARELRGRTALTDADGRFDLTDLPAGSYQVLASKAGYVQLEHGQRSPLEPGQPVELADGQLVNAINFALPRGGVIAGRVVDEVGDPVTEVMVSASRYRYMRGQRTLQPSGRLAPTNDLGQFRVYGLPPGDYIVTATVPSFQFPGAQVETSGYAPTYFPGTSSLGEAQRVRVAAGQEAAADFSLIPARLSRISGTVLLSSGKPAPQGNVRLIDRSTGGSGLRRAAGGRVSNDGSFTINGVAPGTYTLLAVSGLGLEQDISGLEMGRQPVTITGEDIAGLVATTVRGATVRGKIVFAEGQTTITPASISIGTLQADADEVAGMGMGGRQARVADNLTFSIPNVFGRTLLTVNAGGSSRAVALKAVLLGGEDVTDTGIDPRESGVNDVQVVLTSQFTGLTGTVTDGRARALLDYVVVVFSEDDTRWVLPTGRYTTLARSDKDGGFTVSGLPPGDYLAIALLSLESGAEDDPDVLARLRDAATLVQLGTGEKKTLALRLATLR